LSVIGEKIYGLDGCQDSSRDRTYHGEAVQVTRLWMDEFCGIVVLGIL
jgi:hypothetical protein